MGWETQHPGLVPGLTLPRSALQGRLGPASARGRLGPPPFTALSWKGRQPPATGGSLSLGDSQPPPRPSAPLTNRAGGSDDGSLGQDLHDARPHRGRAAAVGVQVAQELLDNQVGVLRLGGGRRAGPQTATPAGPRSPGSSWLGPTGHGHWRQCPVTLALFKNPPTPPFCLTRNRAAVNTSFLHFSWILSLQMRQKSPLKYCLPFHFFQVPGLLSKGQERPQGL